MSDISRIRDFAFSHTNTHLNLTAGICLRGPSPAAGEQMHFSRQNFKAHNYKDMTEGHMGGNKEEGQKESDRI